ncbi:MAG: hypothetical protein KAR40_07635 [Candidatus Sabulitectum sp.]|nr:hypothetical protein [Candidatus Sabulitectum sp.]
MNPHKSSTYLGTYHRGLMQMPWSWWDSLAQLAESKGVRRFSGFLITVPFLVGLLNKIPGEPIQAPWSWLFGYSAGIFFMLGALLVGMWCPQVARYDYRRFKKEGRTWQFILQQLRELYLRYSSTPQRANHMLRGLLGNAKFTENYSDLLEKLPDDGDEILMSRKIVWSLVARAELRSYALDDCLWYLRWFAGGVDERKRMWCWIMFGCGIVASILFLGVQVVIVANHYINV